MKVVSSATTETEFEAVITEDQIKEAFGIPSDALLLVDVQGGEQCLEQVKLTWKRTSHRDKQPAVWLKPKKE